MDIRSLECFVAVAEDLHFRRAAARLHISQPALSTRIRALERSLGVSLLARDRRHVRLTLAGETFLDHARAAVRHARAGRDAMRNAASGKGGRLRLGFTVIAIHGDLPKAVRTFRSRYPGASIELVEMNSPDQELALARGDIDLGIVHPPLSTAGLETLALADEAMVVAVPATHPLAKRKRIAVRELAGAPFLISPRTIGPRIYDAIIALFHNAGVAPQIVQEATPVTTLLGLVSAGVGLGFVPRSFADIKRPGVVCRPLAGNAPTLPLAAAWRRGDTTPLLQRFVHILQRGV